VLQNARGGQGQGLLTPAHTHNIQDTSHLATVVRSSALLQQHQQQQFQRPTTYRPVLQRRDGNVQIIPALDYHVPLLAADGIVARLQQLHANVQDNGELIGYVGIPQVPLLAQRRLDHGVDLFKMQHITQTPQVYPRFQQYQGQQNLESYHVQY
jgi:hypothetical protein